ncbi:MAG: 1-aminocyclopropane-1-carboxylate deaminase/D-cysteine desulfhydrase [Bacteroidia bacterium]
MLSTNVSIEQKIILPEFEAAGVTVFVKRDDMIHPFISGNKWRKLKYNYDRFLKSGCKGIVTFGGAFSNHIIATAAFCAEKHIECLGIIRGERPEGINHVLILAQLWGMKLEFVSREKYKGKPELEDYWKMKNYFIIPEGGENEDGVKGCEEIINELTQTYNHIFCASGTGCTFAGIVKGVAAQNLDTHCHSIAVLKQGEFIIDKVLEYIPDAKNFTVHTDYHFGGYAKTTPELLEFLNSFASQTGILTDPIYTTKLFWGLMDLVKKGYFKKGETILTIHTGGLIGLLSDKMLTDVQKSINEKTLITH